MWNESTSKQPLEAKRQDLRSMSFQDARRTNDVKSKIHIAFSSFSNYSGLRERRRLKDEMIPFQFKKATCTCSY